MFKSTLLTTLILCLCCTGLQAQQTDGEVCEVKPKKAKPVSAWPKYAKMRYVEDYSHVADAKPRDVFDSLKHISLGDDPDWYVSFGGQARLRFEHYQNFNFGRPASNDDGYLLQRYFLHADLHMGKLFRIFAEMRSAWATDWGLTNPTTPHPTGFHDEFDIMNLFGELNFDLSDDLHSTIRAGRWEMNYGMGRMIGCRDWSQTRRPFDGASIRLAKGKNWIDGFWAKWVEIQQYEAFNASDEDIASWGVYAHLAKGTLPFNTELYLLGKDNTTGSRDDHRISTGLRFFGDIAKTNFTFDIEGAYQFDYEGTDVEAGFFAAELTYKFKQYDTKPWITVGFDWASGDDNMSDGTIKTFEPVSAFGHYYFGYIDQIGRQNILSPWLRVGCKPMKKLTTSVEGHWFWADESADGIYSPCNCTKVMRGGNSNADSYIGFELDLVAKYKLDHHTMIMAGYSYLWAGDYVDDTGAGTNDIQRFYMQFQFNF